MPHVSYFDIPFNNPEWA